ncbi:MAG: M15 family metallopeptidase [Cocleimonas sp.]
MYKRSAIIISAFILSLGLLAPLSAKVDDNKPLDTRVVENYLMGKFNPKKHQAFVKVPARYANRKGYYLRKSAFEAFKKMHEAARQDGVKLIIRSATRNFAYQDGIWEKKWHSQKKKNISNKAKALNILKYSSMPGTSRHHWGTEVDLNAFNNKWFERDQGLKLFNWMNANAAKYGFHRPYTKKDENRPTGYNEEKWHWSYTPLSIPMLRDAKSLLNDSKITGFIGSETARQIGVVDKYILGVSQSCR